MKGTECKFVKYMEGADKRFVIPVYQRTPRNHFHIAASPINQKPAKKPKRDPRIIASNISLIESIVIIFYLLSLIVTGGSITTACLVVVVTLDLFKEIVFFIRSEIILSSGLSAKRFAVSKLLEIIKTASNSLVAVAVKSVEIDGSSAVDTGIYFGWDYEQRIDAQINRLVDLRSEINAAIESMENPEERLLLKYRYLKNESWEDISYELNVSYRTVHRIHASALNNFIVPE